ncbi:MAG: hypothetical protein NT051_04140 [Candidatus Micrarchaeota archaeon]|nr:hypothetical protein [Candidatus Micrarchaeota archaeon]
MNKTLAMIGIVLVIAGVITGAYSISQSQMFGLFTTSSTPYQEYMIPLIVGGLVLIIAGMYMGSEKK